MLTASTVNLRGRVKYHQENIGLFKHSITKVRSQSLGRGPSWQWSYGSWIYNYLCNQCLLPLILRVRSDEEYNIKW
jgi:hypothetical protein